MFDVLVTAAAGARGAAGVGAWARVENAACARRLFAIADVLAARLAADGSAEREQWVIDNWDAVAAEVAAAQQVSLGVASHQLVVAWALLRQLPDATMIWTSPSGQSHRTYPGSRLLFPSLCRPTAPVARVDVPAPAVNRGLMMPRRKSTREQDRAKRIDAERAGNQELREDGPENDCDDSYFPSRPPPAGDEDPPPF